MRKKLMIFLSVPLVLGISLPLLAYAEDQDPDLYVYSDDLTPTPGEVNAANPVPSAEIYEEAPKTPFDPKIYEATHQRRNTYNPNTHQQAMEVAVAVAHKEITLEDYLKTRRTKFNAYPNSHEEAMEVARALANKDFDFAVYEATRESHNSYKPNSHQEAAQVARAVKKKEIDLKVYIGKRNPVYYKRNNHREAFELAKKSK